MKQNTVIGWVRLQSNWAENARKAGQGRRRHSIKIRKDSMVSDPRTSVPLPSHISVLLLHHYSLQISRFTFRLFWPLSHDSFARNYLTKCLRRRSRAYRASGAPYTTSMLTMNSTTHFTRRFRPHLASYAQAAHRPA